MTDQPDQMPFMIHVGLDAFGDPLCTLEFQPPPDGRVSMTPGALQHMASYLMAGAASANASAAMFRSLIGEGTAPDVAAAYVAKIMG